MIILEFLESQIINLNGLMQVGIHLINFTMGDMESLYLLSLTNPLIGWGGSPAE